MNSTSTLQSILQRLSEIAASKAPLSKSDERLLSELAKTLGLEHLPVAGGLDLLSARDLEMLPERKTTMTSLINSLAAIAEADSYEPKILPLGAISLPVHNLDIASHLRANYSAAQFSELFTLAQEAGGFKVSIQEDTGLVRTSDASENWHMSARQWVTDTVRCGDLEREINPPRWRRALLTLCRFYNQKDELNAIEQSVKDPDWYRLGGPINGVAHIFIPDTLHRDESWFNNKRLESHGLALQALCELATSLVSNDELEPEAELFLILDTIANLASYLKSINTNPKNGQFDFDAPSAGAWEEIPFAGGLTSDTEAMRAGFAALQELIQVAPEKLRDRLVNSRFGAWLSDAAQLKALIDAAHLKIMDRLFGAAHPIENPIRPTDSSLSFISTSTIKLSEVVAEDVTRHFQVLSYLEETIVRDNGIIRYAPFPLKLSDGKTVCAVDSYLTRDFWILPSLRAALQGHKDDSAAFDSSDCSSEEDFVRRNSLALPDCEAQWFMVSIMASGYCRQVSKLLDLAAQRPLTTEESSLLNHGQEKATQMINRSYARFTGTGRHGEAQLKANGMQCQSFALPEAYEFVSTTDGKSARALPGADTPLAWAEASLFDASRRFLQNLERLAGFNGLNGLNA